MRLIKSNNSHSAAVAQQNSRTLVESPAAGARAPTWTSPVRCSSTPATGSCRKWLFLRLSRARLSPEKTPRGRLRSRLAFRNNSCSDGMESKVPGSTSRISLYSKYRYLQTAEVLGRKATHTRSVLLTNTRNAAQVGAELPSHQVTQCASAVT